MRSNMHIEFALTHSLISGSLGLLDVTEQLFSGTRQDSIDLTACASLQIRITGCRHSKPLSAAVDLARPHIRGLSRSP